MKLITSSHDYFFNIVWPYRTFVPHLCQYAEINVVNYVNNIMRCVVVISLTSFRSPVAQNQSINIQSFKVEVLPFVLVGDGCAENRK